MVPLRYTTGYYLSSLRDALQHWDGFARFSPAREVPRIRKTGALSRFYGLDAAVAALEENAFVIVRPVGRGAFIDQREAVALGPQAGVLLDEGVLLHPQKTGQGRNLRLFDADKARPAATLGAALALVVDFLRHTGC